MSSSTPRGSRRLGDAARLEALRATGLMHARAVPSLDRLTRLAARWVNAPVALVSLVAQDRQVFTSAVGLREPWATVRETPLSHSFCQYVVTGDGPMVVSDAREDDRVRHNLAVPDLGVKAYAGFPLRTPEGEVLGSFCVIDDQVREWTDEELALVEDLADAAGLEVALRLRSAEKKMEAARMRAVLDSATGTSIVGCDTSGMVTVFNHGAERLLGYDADDVVGIRSMADFHDADELAFLAADLGTPSLFAALVADVHDTALHRTRDWTYLTADGQPRTASVTMSAILDAVGDVVGYLAVGEDVTVRRQAERALRDALAKQDDAVRRLEELDQAKRDFVASASHELRTPIASILGYTELLIDGSVGDMTPQQTTMLERVDRSGRRLLHLVEDFLSLAKIEAGSFKLNLASVDLRDVVHRASDAVRPTLVSRRLEWLLDLPEQAAMLDVDADQVERALVNLLNNAIKFTPDGGSISVQVRPSVDRTELRVSDTGIGIAAGEQASIFEQFVRTDSSERLVAQGAGLGLSIVQAIVEGHGGRVVLDSESGAGTTVTLTLPHVRRGS